ncbi:MAG: hypothetical protein FJ041_01925 [Candidatus Cloacimonetes bacterium]|nr:hypothetical protein [Candidatus Cloacimonadota bacterium]
MSKKVLVLLGLLLIVLISNLCATESRIMALGNMQGFTRDNTDVFIYPGTIFKYLKSADVELRGQGMQSNWSIGTNMPLSSFVVGAYLNRPTGIDLDAYLNHSNYTAGNLDIQKKVQFLLGLADKYAVGFAMAMDSYSNPLPSKKELSMSAMYFEFNGGMSTDNVDLGASISVPMASVENESTKEEDALTGFGFNANARYFIYQGSKLTTTALGNFGFSTIGEENKAGSSKAEYSYGQFMFDVGIGAEYKIAENNNLIFGVYPFKYAVYSNTVPNSSNVNEDDKYSMSYLYLPQYKMAFESQILSWLKGRVGANQDFYFYNYTEEEYNQDEVSWKRYSSAFNAYLGFGIKFKRFTVDGVVNDAFLFNGPDFIGGTAPGISSKLSVSYDYN